MDLAYLEKDLCHAFPGVDYVSENRGSLPTV